MDDLNNVWVSELIFAVDVDTQEILDVTGDVEACLGSSPSLLVGRPLFGSIHRDDIAEAQAAFSETMERGRATWEGRVQRIDGVFVRYGWEGRLGLDGKTIYARSRDVDRVRAVLADIQVFERLADLTTDLMFVVTQEGRIVHMNKAVSLMLQFEEDELLGSLLTDHVTDEGKLMLAGMPARLAAGESVIDFRVTTLNAVGDEMVMEGTATFDSVTGRWYVVEHDVTHRVAYEQELEITQRFFDLSSSQLVLIDADDRVVRANQSFLDLVDWDLDDLEGCDVLEALRLVGGDDVRSLLASVRNGDWVETAEVRSRVAGVPLTIEVQLAAAVDGGTVYLICRDVTEERSLRSELMQRASRDPLTGLANRTSLLEAIESDLASGTFVAVVMLDLDGFKKVNDSLGHAAGDMLLVRIAERLRARTRTVDLVARMGGDEFVVLLRGVPDMDTVGVVCENIRCSFQEPFDVGGRPIEIFASIGGTGGHKSSHSFERLLLEADLAAYSAKRIGTDQWRVFDDELRAHADLAVAVEEHLRRVLSADEFELEIVEFTDTIGEPIGVGVIAPAVAISGERRWNPETMQIARNLGLVGPISARLTEEAICQLAPWLHANPDCYLEIVFSTVEVSSIGFLPTLLAVLSEHGVGPDQFVVSLAGLDDVDAHALDPASIDAIRAAGIRVALAESCADTHTMSVIAAVGIDRIDVDAAKVAATGEGSVRRLVANTVLDAADRLGIVIMIDASFTPDVVDVVEVFANCAPVGVSYGEPIFIETFLEERLGSDKIAGVGAGVEGDVDELDQQTELAVVAAPVEQVERAPERT